MREPHELRVAVRVDLDNRQQALARGSNAERIAHTPAFCHLQVTRMCSDPMMASLSAVQLSCVCGWTCNVRNRHGIVFNTPSCACGRWAKSAWHMQAIIV
eukprot:6477725-Amphidinium_carterae.1